MGCGASSNSREVVSNSGSEVEGGPRSSGASNMSSQPSSFTTESREQRFRNANKANKNRRNEPRHTQVVGCQGIDGAPMDLDDRPFHKEKVERVPTKAQLKPPRQPNSAIADPSDLDDY